MECLFSRARYYCSMSNLIPEVRTDKNGRSSVRWVKPEWDREPSGNRGIPKIKDAGGESARKELMNRLNEGRHGLDKAIAKTVTGKTAQLLNELLARPRDKQDHNPLVNQIIINIENPRLGKYLNEFIIRHYDRATASGINVPFDFMAGIIENGHDLTEDQEWALLRVTFEAAVIDEVETVNVPFPHYAMAIKDKELEALVMERPESADDIALIVGERKTCNAATIRGLLDTTEGHSALTHGKL